MENKISDNKYFKPGENSVIRLLPTNFEPIHKGYLLDTMWHKYVCPIEQVCEAPCKSFYIRIKRNGYSIDKYLKITEGGTIYRQLMDALGKIPGSMEDVTGSYSCGECGWWGDVENCDLELKDVNNPDGDGRLRCPECGSERVGEITEEDFKPGNMLEYKLWRGELILFKK